MQPTGNLSFDAAVRLAENARQTVLRTAGVTQTQARAADIAYFQAVIAAGAQYGIATLNEAEALIELGTSPIPLAN